MKPQAVVQCLFSTQDANPPAHMLDDVIAQIRVWMKYQSRRVWPAHVRLRCLEWDRKQQDRSHPFLWKFLVEISA